VHLHATRRLEADRHRGVRRGVAAQAFGTIGYLIVPDKMREEPLG
jgi:hypothetical protein